MELIQCSNCNEQISSKAVFCPQCGQCVTESHSKEEMGFNLCSKCKAQLPLGAEYCPNCGCPVTQTPLEEPTLLKQTPGDASTKTKKTKTHMVIIIAVIVAVVIATIIGSYIYQKIQAQEAAEAAAIALEQYEKAYQTTAFLMSVGVDDAEEQGNLIKKVWYNAIYKEMDDATDPYTRPDGYFLDFNDALNNLFSDEEFIEEIQTMKRRQENIRTSMKRLKDVPEGYEDAYEALKKFYDAYTSMTNMVADPNGSFNTFTEALNKADSEVVACYDALLWYLED